MAEITLKGEKIHTTGELPAEGDKAPNFELIDQSLKPCHMSDFQGKKKFMYIVPSLDTEVCLKSSKRLNELAKSYPSIAFLVISADLPFAQKRACGVENMDNLVTLSMMRSKDFARDYGILIDDGPLQGLCARALVIVDDNNRVAYRQLIPEITEEPDFDVAMEKLNASSEAE